MFQSAPVITDGRACEAYYEVIRYKTFQSAPVITDGRADSGLLGAIGQPLFQSAPVITDGRAPSFPTACFPTAISPSCANLEKIERLKVFPVACNRCISMQINGLRRARTFRGRFRHSGFALQL